MPSGVFRAAFLFKNRRVICPKAGSKASSLHLQGAYFKSAPYFQVTIMKQRTISREVSLKGKALHTGDEVRLTLKPAPVDTGVVFRRTDLYGKPEIRSRAEF